jgi:nucleotide-binding universal stress UspA family protein
MPKRILVGYDPDHGDPAPVHFGVAAARFTGARLIVASVSLRDPDGRQDGPNDEGLCLDATSALAEVREQLDADGTNVEWRELRGWSAPRALHEAAEKEDAGLLVVGSSRRGVAGRIMPGSTAERLIHGAPCPISVVPSGREPGEDLRTIGVAWVDSPEANEALRGAHALARAAGASLHAITVVRPRASWYSETEAEMPPRPGRDFTDVEGEHRVEAEQALKRAVAGMGDDVPVEVEAFIGEPPETLIDLSRHHDLLVCGSRGYGPLRAVLLGGVSRRVATEARCPVVVLPRGVEASLEALVAPAPGEPAHA